VGVGAENVIEVTFQEKIAQNRPLDTDVPMCPTYLKLAHVMRIFEVGYPVQPFKVAFFHDLSPLNDV